MELDAREEARALLEHAIAVLEESQGANDPELGVHYGNLAGLYHLCGRSMEAERWYRRAISHQERVLGPTHADLAISLNNLARLLEDSGRAPDALSLARRACSIVSRVLPAKDPNRRACEQTFARLAGGCR
jgi:tetratricopeptide (TPR) repeat protein